MGGLTTELGSSQEYVIVTGGRCHSRRSTRGSPSPEGECRMSTTEQIRDAQVVPTASGARLTSLLAGQTYRVDTVDPQGRVLDSALVAPERCVRPSRQGHVIDGAFTCVGSGREWADIEPVRGRYCY
jgi:hypothetical protein